MAFASVVLALGLSGCGGGDSGKTSLASDNSQAAAQAVAKPESTDEAHRFLVQATFGPRADDIARVREIVGDVP